MTSSQTKVRDIRTQPFLWIHRNVLATIQLKIPSAKRMHAIAVYTGLAYHSRQDRCSLEIRKLGEFVGLSESAVKRTLKVLVDAKIIGKRSRSAKHNGKRICLANEYLLIDVPLGGEKPSPHPPRKA